MVTWIAAATHVSDPEVGEPERLHPQATWEELELWEGGKPWRGRPSQSFILFILPLRAGFVGGPQRLPPCKRCGLDTTVLSQSPAPCPSGSG